MLALTEAEDDLCPGCGSFLSFSTKKDHGLSITPAICHHCNLIGQTTEQFLKQDEGLKGSIAEVRPEARRIFTSIIPLPEQAEEASPWPIASSP